jgi:hypothetical protein
MDDRGIPALDGGPAFRPPAKTRPDVDVPWPHEADGWSAAGDEPPLLTGVFPSQRDRSDPLDERRTGRTVVAEWALWGKGPRDLEYSVLRCSEGTFSASDFHAVITRYTPGTKETLPQYTVCWIPDENGREGYLAVAIHELADPDSRRSGGRARSAHGREIEYIRLFCVSYSEMAKNQLGYTELIESVGDCQLPAGSAAPVTVDLLDTETPSLPSSAGLLAENVATLLLTNRPVCVLGADRVTAEDRLHFIDQVMSLLPYGLRATMSASTWASATARNLKLRLSFVGAERDDGGATLYTTWGQSVKLDFSGPESTPLRHYVNWLQRGGSGATAELANQTDPVRFDRGEIRRLIANLPRDRPVGDVLEELADGLRRGQLEVIRPAVKRLRQRRNRPRTAEERQRYSQQIGSLGLFKDHPALPSKTAGSVYRILLELAVGPVVSYTSYCDIEDCVGGPPGPVLSREMAKLKFKMYLPWMLTNRLAASGGDKELMASLREQGIPPTAPVSEVCGIISRIRPAHRPASFDLAVRYLRLYAAEPREELARRGYVADTLEAVFPQDRQAQRNRLKEMLTFVYGRLLSEEESAELIGRPEVRATAAFEEAVSELTARRETRGGRFREVLTARLPRFRERQVDVRLTVKGTVIVLVLGAIAFLVLVIIFGLLLRSLHL